MVVERPSCAVLGPILILIFFHGLGFDIEAQVQEYYRIDSVQIPQEISLEVGGMAFNDKGELGVTTRRGDLWLIKNLDSKTPRFVRYAYGMHEPLGLAFRDGSFYCSQRGELTKLTDTDNDDRADYYQTIYSWDLAGNYHEYSYGPLFTEDGDMLVTLNLGWVGRGASLSKWRGWMLKITEDGIMTPIATGMRSPAGFAYNKNGDIFYTENQGGWVGSGRMTHVELGDFVGNPEGLKWTGEPGSPLSLKPEDINVSDGYTIYDYSKVQPELKPPSVWFPHTIMGISTSDIALIGNEFGPFEGQLLVGDQGHSKVMRVYQEKVNGVYQGACFPFVDGFSSGVLRLTWSPDEKQLFVGMTSRGWASTGPKSFGLERLTWTGKMPFEIKTIKAMETGFELEFTKPITLKAKEPGNYTITDFTYKYHGNYGSPIINKESRSITNVQVSDDFKKVKIEVDKLRPGYIYEIKANGVEDTKGNALLHSFAFYTLNEIPGGGARISSTVTEVDNQQTTNKETAKNPTQMPSTWNGQIDAELQVATLPGLKFDTERLEVVAGSKVKLTFTNDDDMLHNLVVTLPDQADKVGVAALSLGLDEEEMAYIPVLDEVLYHTSLLQPNASESIYFIAPEQPGTYQFVCTFPGHYTVMRGILEVTRK